MGKEVYSAEPGHRLREGKSLLHEMRNLPRHTCYAQALISQPLASSSALRVHSFSTLEKNSEIFVLLMGMFFILSLAWWIFPQPDFMVVRGGHRKTLIFVLFRMPHFKPALQRALLSFVPFAAACIL